MATYYVVCITKHPTHRDPHTRIQYVGTRTDRLDDVSTNRWSAQGVIEAIEGGTDTFYCDDEDGDYAKVIVATHLGRKYIKTEADSTTRDNLLSKRECDWKN